MTREEYERIKEAEKEHLRKLKQLKQAAQGLERQQRLNQALGAISSAHDALARNDELVDELTRETAQHEARLEIALEAAETLETERQAAGQTPEALDDELVAIKAQQLLRQLKQELDAPPGTSRSNATEKPQMASPTSSPKAAPKEVSDTSPDTPLPDKTIGRMKP